MLRAKTDFRVSVSLGSDATPVPATARFRGVSSFRDCARRKSLRVNLRGKTPRRLSRGAASDKFLLVSMCYDDRYVKTALVSSMASKLELFPLARAYVRLVVENPFDEDDPRRRWENEGLYLLVDDPSPPPSDPPRDSPPSCDEETTPGDRRNPSREHRT